LDLLRELSIALVEPIDSVAQLLDGARIMKNVVRGGRPSVAARLSRENGARLLWCTAVACCQALDLHRFIHIDEQDAIDAVSRRTALNEQRNRQDDIRAGRRRDLALHVGADQGMQNGIQICARDSILEDEVSERPPIQFSIGGEYGATKSRDDLTEPWCSGRNDRTGGVIRIDDRNAEFRKSLRSRALAAGDAPRETDSQRFGH
jgi:hypothetical protein